MTGLLCWPRLDTKVVRPRRNRVGRRLLPGEMRKVGTSPEMFPLFGQHRRLRKTVGVTRSRGRLLRLARLHEGAAASFVSHYSDVGRGARC